MDAVQEIVTLRGELLAILRGPDGRVRERVRRSNLIVTVGKNHMADQMSDSGETAMSHLAIGTGTTAPVVGNTTLETEIARAALDSKTQNNNVVTYIATFGAGVGTGAITEAGLLNAAAAGTLLNRVTFAVINKGAADSLQLTFTVTYT
jgi:hypothetical protein